MDDTEILEALVELARDAGLEVRLVGRSPTGDSELPPTSGTCRVRGGVWIVLSAGDPLETQIAVLADAIRTHARGSLESRYLPPAVRDRLTGGSEPT